MIVCCDGFVRQCVSRPDCWYCQPVFRPSFSVTFPLIPLSNSNWPASDFNIKYCYAFSYSRSISLVSFWYLSTASFNSQSLDDLCNWTVFVSMNTDIFFSIPIDHGPQFDFLISCPFSGFLCHIAMLNIYNILAILSLIILLIFLYANIFSRRWIFFVYFNSLMWFMLHFCHYLILNAQDGRNASTSSLRLLSCSLVVSPFSCQLSYF